MQFQNDVFELHIRIIAKHYISYDMHTIPMLLILLWLYEDFSARGGYVDTEK